MEAPETIEIDSPHVVCDGGGGALGHPRVYLNAGNEGRVECPYCNRLFVVKAGKQDVGGKDVGGKDAGGKEADGS